MRGFTDWNNILNFPSLIIKIQSILSSMLESFPGSSIKRSFPPGFFCSQSNPQANQKMKAPPEQNRTTATVLSNRERANSLPRSLQAITKKKLLKGTRHNSNSQTSLPKHSKQTQHFPALVCIDQNSGKLMT